MDAKQNISSIRHFLKKRHWVSDVFAGMCLYLSIVIQVLDCLNFEGDISATKY